MSRLLVTGGGGLLGQAVRALAPSALCVTREDADLTDLGQTRRLFERVQPTTVLHLAAVVGGVKANAERGADLFAANVMINTNVLATAQATGVQRLIAVLSSCAFPQYPDRPSTEDDLHAGMPYQGNVGYGFSKRMLDIHARLLREQYGCKYSTVTPVTMYGPYDNFDPETGHVVGALIRKCHHAMTTGAPFDVWGAGHVIRQFVYAPDVANWLIREIGRDQGPGTAIVAPDKGVSIFDLAHLIARTMGYPGEPRFDATKPEGVAIKRLRSRRLVGAGSEFTFTSLEQGMRATVQWFLDHEAGERPAPGTYAGSRKRERCSTNA
jgi:GDP-L-fucose synthase